MEPKLWEIRLLHAAKTRNSYVHENAVSADADAVSLTLDSYFASFIKWIFFATVKFESHERLLDMLDLSPELKILSRQIEDRERALRTLGN